MKKKFLEYLVCLSCGTEKLTLEIFSPVTEAGKSECYEGLISCPACGAKYPVIDGIPRFLSGVFFDDLSVRHRDFFKRYGILKERGEVAAGFTLREKKIIEETRLKKKTQESFGFQWQAFGEMDEESYRKHFLSFIDPPVRPEFFRGKRGIDAGCGFGRHMYFAAKWGAEMVGVDLSEALYPAYRNTKDLDNTYLVQADLYNIPLKKDFDFVYSLGVLHHLPDPFRGFKSVSGQARPGGSVFVWVYSKKAPEVNIAVEALRLLLNNLPYRMLYFLCFIITFFEWYFVLMPYKIISGAGFIKKMLDSIAPHHIIMYSGYPFRMNVADWQDRLSAPKRWYFSAEDMKDWFEKQNLKDIMITPTERYGFRAFGRK